MLTERIRSAGSLAWALVGLVVVTWIAGVVAWKVRVIWPPLILAGAIVFLLNPIVTWMQRHRVPRVAGAGVTYLAFFGLVTLVGFLVAPLVGDQADELGGEWDEIEANIEEWVDDLADRSESWPISTPTYQEILDSLESNEESFGDQLTRARDVGLQIFHVAIIILLAPIIAFYLLLDLPHLRRVAESLIPDGARTEVMMVSQRLNRAIGGFFRGQLLVAIIVGIMVSVGLAVIDLPFWLIVGMIAGLFNMIPLIGPYIGAVPGIVIALTTRDVGTAVWVAVIMTGAQQIDNHFISPLVMQRAVRLHPAAVMLALLAGGTLGGFFGLLLAVPVTAVLKIVGGHLWRRYVLGQDLSEIAESWQTADVAAAEAVGGLVGGLHADGGPATDDAGQGQADRRE